MPMAASEEKEGSAIYQSSCAISLGLPQTEMQGSRQSPGPGPDASPEGPLDRPSDFHDAIGRAPMGAGDLPLWEMAPPANRDDIKMADHKKSKR